MVVACTWWWLVHGGSLYMVVDSTWWWLVHGGGLYMVVAYTQGSTGTCFDPHYQNKQLKGNDRTYHRTTKKHTQYIL